MQKDRTSSDDEDSNKMPSPQPEGQTLAEVKEIEFMLQTMEIGLKKVVSDVSYQSVTYLDRDNDGNLIPYIEETVSNINSETQLHEKLEKKEEAEPKVAEITVIPQSYDDVDYSKNEWSSPSRAKISID